MMKISIPILYASVLLLLVSCEKDLDFKYHEIEPLTVIEGELTAEGIRVAIMQTTPMGEPMNRTLMTDAKVTLYDLTAESTYILTPDDEGYFIERTGGIIGHDYQLTVMRNGETWMSETTMYPPVEIMTANFSWIKMPYDYVSALQVLYKDNPEVKGENFWVKIYRNGEIYSWTEQEDRASLNGMMSYVSLMSRQDISEEDDDDILIDGDEVTVKIYAISTEMREYLVAIGNDSSGPALFSGNRVLGYFLASSPVSRTVVYRPDDFPYWK